MAGKQYVSAWLIDMLDSGPYRDEREVKAEQQKIRSNARAEVDKIWSKAQAELAPPPVAPLPPPDWGMAAPPPPPQEMPPPVPVAPPVVGDPGIGVASRLAEPPPVDYWEGAPRPLGEIEAIV